MNHRLSSLAALFLIALLCFPLCDVIGQTVAQPAETSTDQKQKPIPAGDAEVVALSADGTRLAVADDDLVRVIDPRDGRVLLEVADGERQVFGVILRADGARLAIIRTKNRPFWATEITPRYFYGQDIEAQRESRPRVTGGSLGSGGGSPHELRKFSLGDSLRGDPNRQPYVTSGNNPPPPPFSCRIEIWDLNRREMVGTVYEGGYAILAASYSADGSFLRVMGADLRRHAIPTTPPPADKVVEVSTRIVRGEGKLRLSRLKDGNPTPMTILGADSNRMVSLRAVTLSGIGIGIADGRDAVPAIIDPKGSTPPPWCIDLAPDGRRFVTAGEGNQVYVWDFNRRSVDKTIQNDDQTAPFIPFVAFDSDSSRVVSIDSTGVVRVYGLESDKPLFKQDASILAPRAATLVGDQLTLVHGGIYQKGYPSIPLTIRTFDLKEGEAVSPGK